MYYVCFVSFSCQSCRLLAVKLLEVTVVWCHIFLLQWAISHLCRWALGGLQYALCKDVKFHIFPGNTEADSTQPGSNPSKHVKLPHQSCPVRAMSTWSVSTEDREQEVIIQSLLVTVEGVETDLKVEITLVAYFRGKNICKPITGVPLVHTWLTVGAHGADVGMKALMVSVFHWAPCGDRGGGRYLTKWAPHRLLRHMNHHILLETLGQEWRTLPRRTSL